MRWPRALLPYFLSKRRYLLASSCIHVATALFAWPRRAVKPQRPQGLRHQAQGLDDTSARRAIIGHRASDFLSRSYQLLFSPLLEVEVLYFNLIQGWSPLLNVCGARRITLYPVQDQSCTKVPHTNGSRARGSKEDGTYLHAGIFQPRFSAATHPPWIGISILSAIEAPVAVP